MQTTLPEKSYLKLSDIQILRSFGVYSVIYNERIKLKDSNTLKLLYSGRVFSTKSTKYSILLHTSATSSYSLSYATPVDDRSKFCLNVLIPPEEEVERADVDLQLNGSLLARLFLKHHRPQVSIDCKNRFGFKILLLLSVKKIDIKLNHCHFFQLEASIPCDFQSPLIALPNFSVRVTACVFNIVGHYILKRLLSNQISKTPKDTDGDIFSSNIWLRKTERDE